MSDQLPTQPSAEMDRRKFLKILAFSGLSLGLGVGLSRHFLEAQPGNLVQDTRLLMGTVINLTIVTPDTATGRAAVQAAFSEMESLIQVLDHRRPASLLAKLNAQGFLEDAPEALLTVLGTALEYGRLTQGAFDPSVKPALIALQNGRPVSAEIRQLIDYRQIQVIGKRIQLGKPGMALTLDGLAKGYIIDRGTAVLRRWGFENVLMEAGGDMMALGEHAGKPWKVGVLNPRDKNRGGTIARLSIQGAGLATSGDYMYSFTADFIENHIIDPHTGQSPTRQAAATVIAPDVMHADVLSTSLMVLPPEAGLALVAKLPGVQAMLVGKDLSVCHSTGFPAIS
jgi:thiamine biosynthesis lipoprotein